jgi:hypothetical protein
MASSLPTVNTLKASGLVQQNPYNVPFCRTGRLCAQESSESFKQPSVPSQFATSGQGAGIEMLAISVEYFMAAVFHSLMV